ncbi:MAG: alpha/beta fold hydrolase [Firmicutes bacterium]|nr:alpha/beta fold hydrolase [Bacillota bacterium]
MKRKQRLSGMKPGTPFLIYFLIVALASIGAALIFINTGRMSQSPQNPAPQTNRFPEYPSPGANTPTPTQKSFFFIDNWYMNTRVLFVLDSVWHRMGNTGEILDTVKRIRHTSELSWFREWNKTAVRVQAEGDASLKRGHKISAGESYLRAANYYLAAEVFLHTNPDDPRILATYQKGAEYFLTGLKLLGIPVTEVRIPYEETTLKGYFFRALKTAGKAPTLLVHQGFDAPVEATKYVAEEAIRRGYHCLLFEGPGQGLTIRAQKIHFRPDWEKVVAPVVDYLCARPEVDRDRLILMGISLGGGLAARAAAFEPRLRACIVNPGYLNIYAVFKDILTPTLVNLYEEDPEEFNQKFLDLTRYDVGIRWGLYHGMWVFGGKTPAEFLTNLKAYNYEKVIGQIHCQMLIMDGTQEAWGAGQAKKLYDRLSCPKDYLLFTGEDSAATHCQGGAPALSTQRLFDWLDEHVK